MSINLANVNISIREFQRVSSGDYNAGEVKLNSETTLGKVNHHIKLRGSNKVSLSHAEVIAVKEAFIKALSRSGVDAGQMAEIRRKLGLGADSAMDRTLHERSLKPLTRQQVREILDEHADTINAHVAPNTIRTAAAKNARLDQEEVRHRMDLRNEVNASLAGAGGTKEHGGLAHLDAIISGDVDFRPYQETKEILGHVRRMLSAILKERNGAPSAEREAVITFTMPASRQSARIATGMNEAAFVRKLEEMVFRLTKQLDKGDNQATAARAEFCALAGAGAREEWLGGLAGKSDGGFKARTAVVRMLMDAGIGDQETLSAANRLSDANAIAFALQLAKLDGTLRGDALRNSATMQQFAALAANAGADVPQRARAAIPVLSAEEWNEEIRKAMAARKTENLPHDIRALLETVPAMARERFGMSVQFHHLNQSALIPPGAQRATAENLRGQLETVLTRHAAEKFCLARLRQTVMDLCGREDGGSLLRNDWRQTHPEMLERLFSARNAAEARALLDEFRDTIEADAKRLAAVERSRQKAVGLYRETLARRLGVPVACLSSGLDLNSFDSKSEDLGQKLRRSQSSPEEVEAAFRDYAEKAANARADAIQAVDMMPDLPPALRDYLKPYLLTIQRVDKIDLSKTVAASRAALADTLDVLENALNVPNAKKDDVYKAMAPFGRKLEDVVRSLYPPGTEIGSEEKGIQGDVALATVLFARAGLVEKLDAFFARPDVKADNAIDDPSTPSYAALSFKYALRNTHSIPDPQERATLAASLGTPSMPLFQSQALMGAFEDAGLGNLPVAEKMAILRPSHPAGAALAEAIRNANCGLTPSRVRDIAAPILRMHAAAAPAARGEADAARMEALLAKYGGGLAPADLARLRAFAEALDFSEAAAPASEKTLAAFLDEICGGGGFSNPASSASRRAIAAGATEDDLRLYVRCTGILDLEYTQEESAELLLDPQSSIRRPLDAALARLPANSPLDQKELAALAIYECRNDADLLDIVTRGIARVTTSGGGKLRNTEGVLEAVERVRNNLRELREVAGNDAATFAAGKNLLLALETRRVAPGFIAHMVNGMRGVDIDPVARLKARSSAADIHAAVSAMHAAGETVLIAAPGAEELLDGMDESMTCRKFIADLVAARLTPRQLGAVHDALQGRNASTLNAFYYDIGDGSVDPPGHPTDSEVNAHRRMAGLCNRFLEGFNEAVGRLAGHNPPFRIPAVNIDDYTGVRGIQDINRAIFNAGREDLARRNESYLRKRFPGTSPAANALRGVFADRLANRPFSPDDHVRDAICGSIQRYLDFTVLGEAKRILASDNLAETRFAAARAAGLEVMLPGNERLSADPAEARDQLARFATGRPDAAWAALSAGERNKVAVLMALLTLESADGATESTATALDRDGKRPAFGFTGANANARRVFRLDRPANAGGAITVAYESELRPTALRVGSQSHRLGPDDRFQISFECNFTAQELQKIEQTDFATLDLAPAEETFNRNPPEPRRLFLTEERIPENARLDLDLRADFTATLA